MSQRSQGKTIFTDLAPEMSIVSEWLAGVHSHHAWAGTLGAEVLRPLMREFSWKSDECCRALLVVGFMTCPYSPVIPDLF